MVMITLQYFILYSNTEPVIIVNSAGASELARLIIKLPWYHLTNISVFIHRILKLEGIIFNTQQDQQIWNQTTTN